MVPMIPSRVIDVSIKPGAIQLVSLTWSDRHDSSGVLAVAELIVL